MEDFPISGFTGADLRRALSLLESLSRMAGTPPLAVDWIGRVPRIHLMQPIPDLSYLQLTDLTPVPIASGSPLVQYAAKVQTYIAADGRWQPGDDAGPLVWLRFLNGAEPDTDLDHAYLARREADGADGQAVYSAIVGSAGVNLQWFRVLNLIEGPYGYPAIQQTYDSATKMFADAFPGTTISADIPAGSETVVPVDMTGIAVGDLLLIVGEQGGGYTSAPTVAFPSNSGSGAAGTATVAGGLVTGVTMTNGGTAYETASGLSFSGGGGSGAAGLTSFDPTTQSISGVAITSGGDTHPQSELVTVTAVSSVNFTATFANSYKGTTHVYRTMDKTAWVHFANGLAPDLDQHYLCRQEADAPDGWLVFVDELEPWAAYGEPGIINAEPTQYLGSGRKLADSFTVPITAGTPADNDPTWRTYLALQGASSVVPVVSFRPADENSTHFQPVFAMTNILYCSGPETVIPGFFFVGSQGLGGTNATDAALIFQAKNGTSNTVGGDSILVMFGSKAGWNHSVFASTLTYVAGDLAVAGRIFNGSADGCPEYNPAYVAGGGGTAWNTSPPTNVWAALDRLAAAVAGLLGAPVP